MSKKREIDPDADTPLVSPPDRDKDGIVHRAHRAEALLCRLAGSTRQLIEELEKRLPVSKTRYDGPSWTKMHIKIAEKVVDDADKLLERIKEIDAKKKGP